MSPTTYKRLRLAIGTQAEAAKLLGVRRELIGLRERGKAEITPEAALAIKAIKPRKR